jgi:regulator of sigma E protease
MTTLLAFLFVLGVLIFVHELGHFLAARRLGVRVLTFSLGFGPKLLKFTRGDTEYAISAIPLGGYVKMAGENPEDARSGSPDEFLSRTKWERFQVLIAGPAMNIILAVVVMAVVLAQGAQVPAYQDEPPVVGAVTPGSPAEGVGIRPGDRILTVAGSEVETWEDLFIQVGTRPDRDVALTLLRDGQTEQVTVRPTSDGRFEIGNIGVLPDVYPRVQAVVPGDPADRAGVKPGDEIVSVNGERMVFLQQASQALRRTAGKPIDLRLRRSGEDVRLEITPTKREGYPVWIGITMVEALKPFDPGPLEAIQLSVERNIEFSGLIFRTLGGMFIGETSLRQL